MNTTANTTTRTAPAASRNSRLSALALASLMTLAMLLGVNGLATTDSTALQMAQQAAVKQA